MTLYATGVRRTGGTVSPPTGLYDAGPITLTATPNAGYEFPGFISPIESSVNPVTFNFTGESSVFVQFAPINPALVVFSPHSGNFSQGQMGAQYTIMVDNSLNAPATTGPVTVTENLS